MTSPQPGISPTEAPALSADMIEQLTSAFCRATGAENEPDEYGNGIVSIGIKAVLATLSTKIIADISSGQLEEAREFAKIDERSLGVNSSLHQKVVRNLLAIYDAQAAKLAALTVENEGLRELYANETTRIAAEGAATQLALRRQLIIEMAEKH